MATRKAENFTQNEILGVLTRKKKFLCKNFGVIDAALFGSYAKNEQKVDSDVDIYVRLKPGYKTFDNFMDLRFFLEEILGRKVDLVTKEAIREEFKTRIFSEAINV